MTDTAVDNRPGPLPPGTEAPEFRLPSTPDQTVSLSDFRGRPLILAFYPEDWSPVCSDQLALYQELLPEFQKFNAELLGISVDGIWSHIAFAKD
jgi:peroxiredoxin